jgi:hypothetical protein
MGFMRESWSMVACNDDGGQCSLAFSGNSTEFAGMGFMGGETMGLSSRGSPEGGGFLRDFLGNRE